MRTSENNHSWSVVRGLEQSVWKEWSFGVGWREEAGGALPTVLMLVTIFTTLAGAVMAVYLVQHRLIRQDVHRLQAYYAAEAGLYEALVRLEQNPQWRAQGEGQSCAETTCWLWAEAYGGFVHLIAEGTVGNQSERLHALAAQEPVPLFESAVALGDEQANLTLAGTTQIIGPVALDQGRVTEGTLQGQSFTGQFEDEVLGELSWVAYEADLPRETMQKQRALLQQPPGDAITIEEVRGENGTGGLQASEEDPQGDRPSVYVEGDLVITEEDHLLEEVPIRLLVAGNLRVEGPLHLPPGTQMMARDTLWVTGAVRGPQSLLVADRVVVVEGWSGGATQVLATREVAVQEGVHLEYPSLLYVEGWMDDSGEMQDRYGGPARNGWIEMQSGAWIDGMAVYPSPKNAAAFEADVGTIVLREGATVRGALYSAARAELSGTVHGSVLTKTFYFYRSPTNYVNWIDGGTVDVTRRPSGFCTPIGFDGMGGLDLELIRLSDNTAPDDG